MNEQRQAEDLRRATITVVIETPKDSRIKFKYAPESGEYRIDRVLPHGVCFPFNYGFIPNTRADDGDPTDVLLVLDEPLFAGCRVQSRVLGLMRADQTENGKTSRNNRVVAIAVKDTSAPQRIEDVGDFLSDVERFFCTYHEAEGNHFTVLGIAGAHEALEHIEQTRVRR